MSIKCFLVKETFWCLLYARRYDASITVAEDGHYHNAMVKVGIFPIEKKMFDDQECNALPEKYETPKDSSIWPTKCEKCNYLFTDKDHKQDFFEVMCAQIVSENEDVSNILLSSDGETPYRENAAGNVITWWPKRHLPPGAMWRASWYRGWDWTNYTEDPLLVMLPDGTEWNIDSRCNNCTMPQDKTHRCWVRTGIPPIVTAGKGGHTCAAGAGSIATGRFHGFLTNGELTSTPDSQIQI